MIKFLIFCLFIQTAFGKVVLEMKPDVSMVSQGEIFNARLIVSEGSVPNFTLRGKTIGKSLYILSIEPFMAKTGAGLEAQSRLIFTQIPPSSSVSETISGEEINVNWNKMEIKPTEAQSFLLGNFEIPRSLRLFPVLLWILGIIGLFTIIFYFYSRWKKKRNHLKRQKDLRDQLLAATSYDEVVELWKQKHAHLALFPNLDLAYKELEKTLFKYQFKPSRSMLELEQVMDAYERFKSDVVRGTDGI